MGNGFRSFLVGLPRALRGIFMWNHRRVTLGGLRLEELKNPNPKGFMR